MTAALNAASAAAAATTIAQHWATFVKLFPDVGPHPDEQRTAGRRAALQGV